MIPTSQATAYWTPTPADLPKIEKVARHYWESAAAPQREWAVQAVTAFGPDVGSLLELGCQAGPNLRALRAACPAMQLTGIDVNAPALAAGRRFIAAARLEDIELREGVVPDALTSWSADSVDVVLSVYCLAYVGPDRIDEALAAGLRIARLGLVLIEPMLTPGHCDETTVAGSTYVEWRHDYLAVLQDVIAATGIHARVGWVTKPPVDRLGHVLVVRKEAADGLR